MTPFKAIMADLDGTLADTAEANFLAYAQALAEVGVSVTRKQFEAAAFGRNWRQFLPTFLAEADCKAQPEFIAQRKAKLYTALFDKIAINRPLIRLIASNRPACGTALVTTASSMNARGIINHHELGGFFDVIVTGDDVMRHKPDPEAYRIAAEKLSVAPEDCLVFEDSEIGVASALAFGAQVLRIQLF